MRLEFVSVMLESFRSFSEPQTLELNLGGLWSVRGRNEAEPALGANGAGKSSVWSAVSWCLYGRTPDDLRGPDVKPWGGGTPHVELVLRIDGDEHVVSRTAKTNGLKIDDKEVGPEEAEHLVGLSFELFRNTVLQAQGQPLFFDRTPKEKMQLFQDVLQLERWEDRSKRAGDRVREIERAQSEIRGEVNATKAALESTEALIGRTTEDSASWEADRRTRVKRFEEEVKALRDLLDDQETDFGNAKAEADSAGTELKAQREEINSFAAAHAVLHSKLAKLSAEGDAKAAEIKTLEKEYDKLGSAKDCPTCGRSLKGTSLAEHQQELKAKIDQLTDALADLETKEKAAQNAVDASEEKGRRLTDSARELERKEDDARSRAQRLSGQVEELRAKLRNAESSRNERKDERNPYIDQLSSLRKQKSKMETQLTELDKDLEASQVMIELTQFWVKGFKDVQLYVIADVLDELELTTNALLAEVGLCDWRIQYDVEKETKAGTIQRGLNVTILSPANDKAVRWESWSGGEGQRLRIVGALALSEVLLTRAGVETNIEVLDEPTRHLSREGVQDLCAFLGDRAKQLDKTIFLVDHVAREGSAFVGSVTVVKTEKGSRIEQ